MDKRNWLWKRRSSEKSMGETESSGSLSSHSERHSDEQDPLKETPENDNQSPEVTSKAVTIDHEAKGSPKKLIEKLSAALVNVSAKEDLVKQHAKVAEEAVAGWEKAENEVAVLKQQLEAAVQQNSTLDVRVNHLNGALKECVRQLRQARDEQEQSIQYAVVEKEKEWASEKAALEYQLLELQTQAEASRTGSLVFTDPNVLVRLECLEKENTALKLDLSSCSEELQIRTTERDLSNQAAETASKQQLEIIKKVTKLEAECRRLQVLARKSSLLSDQRSYAISSFAVESFTNSQSISGDRLKTVDTDSHMMRRLETSECDQSCSDSWASGLIAKLDQFQHEKAMPKTLAARSLEIDMMDDFLEMERLAAVSETVNKASSLTSAGNSSSEENPLAAEYETLSKRVVELEQKLEKIEADKAELENALSESQDALKVSDLQLKDAQIKLEELLKELDAVNESKELLEFQLFGMEVEARTMSANIDSLKTEVEKERSLSTDKETKCQELENELRRKSQEFELQQASSSNGESKIKQEDLAVAADKLAECQKTIASLGKQLHSLATLEDFLIDTANLPGFSGEGSVVAGASGEEWKLHVNETFTRQSNSDTPKIENSSHSMNGNEGESSSSSSSSSSATHQVTTSKSRNGFGKLFSRSKSGIQL